MEMKEVFELINWHGSKKFGICESLGKRKIHNFFLIYNKKACIQNKPKLIQTRVMKQLHMKPILNIKKHVFSIIGEADTVDISR